MMKPQRKSVRDKRNKTKNETYWVLLVELDEEEVGMVSSSSHCFNNSLKDGS